MFDELRRKMRSKRYLYKHIRNMFGFMSGKRDRYSYLKSMILKNCHSIEKGLTSTKIRYGFGEKKIRLILDYLQELYAIDSNAFEIKIARGVLNSYLNLHKQSNYDDKEFKALAEKISAVLSEIQSDELVGGVLELNVKDINNDFNNFEKLVATRHSIRAFKPEKVKPEVIEKAIKLAMLAPSACNRQSTRVYVVDRSEFDKIKGWDAGVKTFIDMVDKILIITGQMSAYEGDEFFQYSVSASIFAAYLTLALHAQGIGCCLLERPLYENQQWESVRKNLSIPDNEQCVCAVAIGVPDDVQKVPVSQRLPYERIVKYVGEYNKDYAKEQKCE